MTSVPRPLRPGEPVPPFAAPDETGRMRTRDEMLGRAYVLYFYPADETPGCVAEACAIRDAWSNFEALGLAVLGVSRDRVETHAAFVRNRRLPYSLLADPEGRMHRDFGALMLGMLPRRVSYLVDAEGHVAATYDSHLRPEAHAARMLEAARGLLPRDTSARGQRA